MNEQFNCLVISDIRIPRSDTIFDAVVLQETRSSQTAALGELAKCSIARAFTRLPLIRSDSIQLYCQCTLNVQSEEMQFVSNESA